MTKNEINRRLEGTPYCVVYFNGGGNPQYKIVPRNEDGTIPDYFAYRSVISRSRRLRDIDIYVSGYLCGRSETNVK